MEDSEPLGGDKNRILETRARPSLSKEIDLLCARKPQPDGMKLVMAALILVCNVCGSLYLTLMP